MIKRARDIYDTPVSITPPSNRKRARIDPGTSSPTRPRISALSPYVGVHFPSTPYAYSIPSDSPSNPFGLKRTLAALTLPRATGFGKHLPLRFQLAHEDKKGKGKAQAKEPSADLDGVYRIVQVPTNYTFRHLHKLILFLFACDAHWEKPPGTTMPTRHRRSERLRSAPSTYMRAMLVGAPGPGMTPRRQDKGKARMDNPPKPAVAAEVPEDWAGHVFEVRHDIALYRSGYKPGVVKPYVGATRVRLSSVRDRKLFPDLFPDDRQPVADEDVFGSPSSSRLRMAEADTQVPGFDDDGDETEWRWEAEDDYTVRQVWPDGPDLSRGIIYVCLQMRPTFCIVLTHLIQHHLPGISIHITINTARVPPRKGVGNQPFVFRWRGSARGAIRIAHTVPKNSRILSHDRGDGDDVLESEIFEDEIESDTKRLRKWNERNAFARFLAREGERESALLRPLRADSPARPRMSNPFDSSPIRPEAVAGRREVSPLPPSSPPSSSPATLPQLSSASRSAYSSASPYSARRGFAVSLSAHAFSALPVITPGPAHPALARRVARASRRLERLTQSGLADMSGSEEEVDELDGDVLFAEDASEVPELEPGQAGDVALAEEDTREGDVHNPQTGTQWVGQGREEDWDPFGEDEV